MLRLLILAFLLGFVSCGAAMAQPPAQAKPPVTPEEARQALEVLQDPQKRAQVVATLDAIAHLNGATDAATAPAAAPTPAPNPPPAAPPPGKEAVTVAPNSVGAEVLMGASQFLNRASGEAIATVTAVRSVPLLWRWLTVMATDPWARGVLLDTAWRLAVVLAIGLITEWAVRRAVRRPILALVRSAPNGVHPPEEEDAITRAEEGETEPPSKRRITAIILLRRVPLVLARLVLELLPVLGFLTVGHLIAATSLGGDTLPRLVLLAVIDAYAVCAAVLCAARMMFAPHAPRLRLLNISDHAAAYATNWTRRIAVVSVFGYAIAEVGLLLGLSDAAHDALLKAVGLADHVFLGIIVLQQRRVVRAFIRAPAGASGPIARLRDWLAGSWHWLALLLLAALWLTWAFEVPHGYTRMVRYLISIIVVAVLARVLQIVILGALDRTMSTPPEFASRDPRIAARLALYHPVLTSIVRAMILIVGILAVLQLWGLGGFDWLVATQLGQRLLASLFALALTTLLAIVVWEAVNAAIERHLAKLTRDAQAARSARLRTLLPLLRATLFITILIAAGMMALSEIGVNIGPLLAGAGIVGVAIGFGSQKLVQDFITGIFLLLENAMQVGDWVTVAGLSGTVENLSIRTIRLRAGDGSVHVIPFSSVTTVSNVNRGLGNAAVNITVAAHENTDRVGEVLKQIVAAMRQEPGFAAQMMSDLQLWGVDKVDGASVTIAGQVVCTDSGRWSVQREFNRRMKQRFEELNIELYNPMQQTVAVRQIAACKSRDEQT
jgi:small-conductance mechanosensitive channel